VCETPRVLTWNFDL